jgi:hypothetical protein
VPDRIIVTVTTFHIVMGNAAANGPLINVHFGGIADMEINGRNARLPIADIASETNCSWRPPLFGISIGSSVFQIVIQMSGHQMDEPYALTFN